MSWIRNPVAGLMALALISGCSTTEEPSYYLLAPAPEAGADRTGAATTEGIVGLRELALPLYARRTQIASVGPDGAVTLSDDHRWAEEVPRAASRVVARSLTSLTGRTVVIEPWPAGIQPDVRVDIEVDYFAGALGGELRLEGQYRIVPAGRGQVRTDTFRFVETAADDSYGALVDSHKRALEALSRTVAEQLAR